MRLSYASKPCLKSLGLTAIGVSVGAAVARWQLGRLFTWQPRYRLELEHGRLQIRLYEHQIHAETTVNPAPWSDALNEGFLRLAGYLFGDNGGQQTISMTTPVLSTITLGRDPRGVASSW